MSDLDIQQRFDAASRLAKYSEDTAEVAVAVAKQLLADGGGTWCLIWQWRWGRLGVLASAGDHSPAADASPVRLQEQLQHVDQVIREAMERWRRKEPAACQRQTHPSGHVTYTLAIEPPLGADNAPPATDRLAPRTPADFPESGGNATTGSSEGQPQRPVLAVQLAVSESNNGDRDGATRHAESLLCGYGLLVEDHLRCQALRQTRADSRRLTELLQSEQQLRQFRHAIGRSLDWERTAMSIVNACMATTRCQRASVMVSGPSELPRRRAGTSSSTNPLQDTPRSRVLAVSGVATMDHRSPLIRRLSHLGDVVTVLDQTVASVNGRLVARRQLFNSRSSRSAFESQQLPEASDADTSSTRQESEGQWTDDQAWRDRTAPSQINGEPTPAEDDWPPIFEQAVEAYIDQSHIAHLLALPLRIPVENDADALPSDTADSWLTGVAGQTPGRPIGVLVLEFHDAEVLSRSALRSEEMAREAAVALRHAVDYSTLPLRSWSSTWRSWFGRSHWRAVVSPRGAAPQTRLEGWLGPGLGHPLRLVAAALVLLLLAILWWVPAELTVTADGTLQPAEVHPCFAPRDGTVTDVFVRHDDLVSEGNALLQMHSPELELEVKRTEGAIESTQKELRAAEAARRRETDDRDPASRTARPRGGSGSLAGSNLAAEEARLRAVLQSYQQQMELLQKEREKLTVRSPSGGTVLTWQLRQSLLGRPVRRGQRLLRISASDSPWTLRLNLPDRNVGHVLEARETLRPDLPVRYLVTGEPGQERWGRLEDWSPITTTTPEGDPVVELLVDLPESTDSRENWRAGTQVRARVHCGSHRLGYVWFHALWDAIRLHLLF